ncbi:PLP-dependent transferase [Sciscionella sediminilitoris]|uniref:PLP-dependent transferase n=1 Tax=Sciscionella sediminilitoris TaxID=1445613 RepID=UPI00068F027F|nr:PLP-dependent transferase [Sciscionella sp. SE31]
MTGYSAPAYRELGLRPVVNAAATLTVLGGSRLAPGAAEAMREASADFVDLPELQRAVGARLAELTGNAAGYVTSGGSAAVTLSVAACLSKDITVFGPPRPAAAVAMFSGHRNPYDYAVRQLGAPIVEFGANREEIAAALGPETACVLWFAGAHYAEGAPELPLVLELAHRAGIPVLVDAAAQIPPVSSLWRFTTELGADAVIVSGGKGLRGPQSSGLLLGSAEIIEGARAHGAPHHAVGRGMKVGKEELLGLLAAVQWTLGQDEAALLARYEQAVALWVAGIGALRGLSAWRDYPSEAGQPHGRAMVRPDPDSGWRTESLVDALWDRDPRIAVLVVDGAIALNPQTVDPGEERLVLQAFREVFG